MSFVPFEDDFSLNNWSRWNGRTVSVGCNGYVASGVAGFSIVASSATIMNAFFYKSISPAQQDLFVRAYFQFTGLPPINGSYYNLINILANGSGSPVVARVGVRNIGGTVYWAISFRTIISGGPGETTLQSSVSPSLNVLTCVELHWKKASAGLKDGVVEAFLNGDKTNPIVAFTQVESSGFGDASQVNCGLVAYQNATEWEAEVRMDDVKINNVGPIGPYVETPAIIDITSDFFSASAPTTPFDGNVNVEITFNGGPPDANGQPTNPSATWIPIGTTPILGYTNAQLLKSNTQIYLRVPQEK